MSSNRTLTGSQSTASIASLLAMLLCLPLFVHARSLDDIQAAGTLSVAVYRDFPPYSWEDNGDARGVDVEIARHLARGLGVDLTLHWMVPDENLEDDLRNHVWKGHYLARIEDGPMLKREVADVMLRAPYDREYAFKVDQDGRVMNDLVHFFAPYQRERWMLLIDDQQIESIENLAIFMYDKVGVEIDSLPDFYLSSAFRGRLKNNVLHYTTVFDALADLPEKKVAAVMGMQSQMQWGRLRLDTPERYQAVDIPLPNLTKPRWEVGMAVKDAYRALGYALEDVITELVNSGEMERIFASYGVDYLRPEHYRVQ